MVSTRALTLTSTFDALIGSELSTPPKSEQGRGRIQRRLDHQPCICMQEIERSGVRRSSSVSRVVVYHIVVSDVTWEVRPRRRRYGRRLPHARLSWLSASDAVLFASPLRRDSDSRYPALCVLSHSLTLSPSPLSTYRLASRARSSVPRTFLSPRRSRTAARRARHSRPA